MTRVRVAPEVLGQVRAVEARGHGRQVHRRGDLLALAVGGERLGIVSDVRGLDPGGALGLDVQVEQPRVRLCQKRRCICHARHRALHRWWAMLLRRAQ